MPNMQGMYPNKTAPVYFDTLNITYPVQKSIATTDSSTTLAHQWRPPAEVLHPAKSLLEDVKLYSRDYNVTKELTRSESTKDFGYKLPETKRRYKDTPCIDNHYIYPPYRQLEQRVPAQRVFGTTEMRSSYKEPVKISSLITDKDQYKHVASLPLDPPTIESGWNKDLEPLYTTHEGFEKYLDPYLTTSRLEHRPFTAKQLARPSVAKDVVTYYTFTDTAFVRTPKPKAGDYWLPLKRPKSDLTYDRAKFREDFREIITHNKLTWVPGTFRTEVRENYVPPAYRVPNYEDNVQNFYKNALASFPTNISDERHLLETARSTENSTVGSRKPISAVLRQNCQRNKKLAGKIM